MNQLEIISFRRDMRTLERESGILLSGETSCCSVTVAQCHLLLEMEALGPSSLQEIADSLSLDKSTLSRTVDSLVREGLVERHPDADNRRKVSLSLTGPGRDKCAYINTLCNGQYKEVFARIPKDRRATVMEGIALLAAAMRDKRVTGAQTCSAR